MLKLFATILVTVLLFAPARAQCFSDTLIPFSVTHWLMDSAAIPCYPYICPSVQQCHYWQFPDSFKGGLFIYNDAGDFEIIILDSCHLVIQDTCVNVGIFPNGYQIHYNFPQNASLVICGKAGETVGVDIKPDMTGLLNNFPPPKIDLDTICGLGIPEPHMDFEGAPEIIDIYTGLRASPPFPAGIYVEHWPENPYRKAVIFRVTRL